MFTKDELNVEAVQLVKNIYRNFNSHPNYAGYKIELEKGYGCLIISISMKGQPVTMFRFYPKPISCDLGSIAIYGEALQGHYNAIKTSRSAFGLPVESVDIVDSNTMSPFVDVYLK